MRILFVSNFYPPHDLGGMEIRCKEAVDSLRQRGHICHVLTSNYGTKAPGLQENDVTRALHLQADIHYYRPLDFFLHRPVQEKANCITLRRILDSFRPDLIFIWGMWNLSTQVAYWAEQWLPNRVAYAIASYWLIEPDVHTAYWQLSARHPWAERLKLLARHIALYKLARERDVYPLELKHVTCVSNYVRHRLLTSHALPYDAQVIYNGIDPEPFINIQQDHSLRQKNELQLIYVGGILPHKGLHTSVKALGLLKQRGEINGLYLTFVGGGHPDYERQLRQCVNEWDLNDYVTFQGRVPREQIPALLENADVFLFTSIWEEPLARSVMEAMAAGLAVIGTPVGGQGEILEDGVNALVFPPDDAAQLAECIQKLRHTPHLCIQLAEQGRKTVLEHFTLVRMVNEIESWLKEIAV